MMGGVLELMGELWWGGGSLAAVYNAGDFRMSTWIPCVWGVINMLVLILSSFSLQGGL